ACCAGFAGAGVTLRCAPTERPPPSRLASASFATRLAPASTTHIPSNHLRIKAYLQLLMLSKADAAMHGNDPCGEVEYFDFGEARRLEHRLEFRLARMHADRLGEIAIRFARACDALTEPGQHLEGIKVLRALQRRPDLGELEHHGSATRLEHPRHLAQRPRHGYRELLPVAMQAERHEVVHQVVALGDAVEHVGDALRLFALGDLAKTEIDFLGHPLLSRVAPAFSSLARYSAQNFSWFSPSS